MAKKKTELTPMETFTKAFIAEINDKELQNRFDGFVRNVREDYTKHLELICVMNSLIKSRDTLAGIILESAIEGIGSSEAIEKYT